MCLSSENMTMSTHPSTEAQIEADRSRLIRLCKRLTGDPHLAEDLAQETLLIGWQKRAQLRDEAKYDQWLNGIARNLSRSWMQRHTVKQASEHYSVSFSTGDIAKTLDAIPDAFDLESELEQKELGDLLDCAMAELPELTRGVLVGKYIDGLPQTELAARLDITEGAVEARTHRGKLTMRRILTTNLRDEAASFGLGLRPEDAWQETRLWCRSCGQKKLKGKFQLDGERTIQLRCECGTNIGFENIDGILDGVKGFGPARKRAIKWWHEYYQQGLVDSVVPCIRCNQSLRLHRSAHSDIPQHLQQLAPYRPESFGIICHCPHCGWWRQTDVEALAGHFSELMTFEKEHKRIVTLSPQVVERAGSPALIVTFQKLGGNQRLDLLFDQYTLQRFPLKSSVG